MQQEDRFQIERIRLSHSWNLHYNWGLRELEWDLDAFQSGRLDILRLQARMRDGTLVEVPTEGRLPTLDLNELLIGKDRITVYLAIAGIRDDGPNVTIVGGAESEQANTRYFMEKFAVADENDGVDLQTLAFRTLNLKLLADTRDITGYEVLEIARFEKATRPGGAPQLDVNYIPPLLACDAWKPLANDILQMLFHHLSSRKAELANKAVTRGITFETKNPGDDKLLGRLAILNEASTVLNTIAFARGIHPFTAYLELCRIVGQLAIFRDDRLAPNLPAYDHDDLGTCFHLIKRHLEADEDKPDLEEREFIGEGLRMQVSVEAKWLEPAWQMFVGVRSKLPRADVIDLLTTRGQLDMKIGCGNLVDQHFMGGFPALEFTHTANPPRVLPPDLTYFQVNRESRQSEWAAVQQSLKLAIRVNHNRLVVGPHGNIQGERSLALKPHGAQAAAAMQFSLFVVAGNAAVP